MWTMNLRACLCAILLSMVLADNTMYELTYDLVSDKIPTLPNSTSYHMDNVTSSTAPLRIETLNTSTAVGTHVQAPCRYQANQQCITDIPINNLVAPVVVMSINATSADAPINASSLSAWESSNGAVASGSIVLIKTGWGSNWSNISAYVGTNDTVNNTNMHFPGLASDAGDYLVKKNVLGVGIDSMSVDYGQSNSTFPVSIALAKNNIYTILNVNLTSVNETSTKNKTVYVMPIKVVGAGAAPCHIFIA